MQDDLFGCRIISSHYILVSRKATFLASLRPLAEEDFAVCLIITGISPCVIFY
jgi:hypothetical protein